MGVQPLLCISYDAGIGSVNYVFVHPMSSTHACIDPCPRPAIAYQALSLSRSWTRFIERAASAVKHLYCTVLYSHPCCWNDGFRSVGSPQCLSVFFVVIPHAVIYRSFCCHPPYRKKRSINVSFVQETPGGYICGVDVINFKTASTHRIVVRCHMLTIGAYFSGTLLLSIFWANRGHKCRPFYPPVPPWFLSRKGFKR